MYLDPGFGGMLIQIVVAVVAAGGVIAFTMRKKIKALFSRNKGDAPTTTTTDSAVSNADDEVIDMLSDEKDESN